MSCPNWYSDESKAYYNLKQEIIYRLARMGFDGDNGLERIYTTEIWEAMERAMLDMQPGRESGMCIHLGSSGICRITGEVRTCDPLVKCIHYGLSCQESQNEWRKEGFTYYIWHCPKCHAADSFFVANSLSGETEVYWDCHLCGIQTQQLVSTDKLEEQVKHGDAVCIYLTPCDCGECKGEYRMCKRTGWLENGMRLADCERCEFYRAYVFFDEPTNTLQQIETLRQELAEKIIELTGLDPGDVEVEIGLQQPKGINDDLATEARIIDWHPDRHGESAWYTSEKPSNGATTVYVE